MARGRQKGKKNRNYPARSLVDALAVPRAIADEASGMKVSRLTLAGLLNTTPTSRVFKELVGASRFYGLSLGGINADEFEITKLGEQTANEDPDVRDPALKAAVMTVQPYKTFFETFKNKKMPSPAPFEEFLKRDAEVEADHVSEVIAFIESDAQTAGLTRQVGNGIWIDLEGTPVPSTDDEDDKGDDDEHDEREEMEERKQRNAGSEEEPPPPTRDPPKQNNAIFVGHGKNKRPRDQLVKILTEYGIPHRVAEDEPNKGRPIPTKVKETMKECGAAILIFSADEELFDKDGNSVWRPSENVVNELGAAGMLYDDRIVIFREDTVNLATNYESIGYITFEHDNLPAKANELLRELIAFGILKVSVNT